MFKIGNVEIKSKVALAPMAGVSNPAYFKICQLMGLDYAVTELISAEAIVRNNQKTLNMLKGIDKLNMKVGVQIFGSNPDTMARAAYIITNLYKNVFIDINMGCPVPKVAIKNQAGAYLLKEPDKVYELVRKVVESVDTIVTVKIRSGWDSNSINAVQIAKMIEKAGAKAICVHPRTRSQGYTGMSDWNVIKEVKKSVNILVIGNGDVKSCFDAKRMIEETNCDAVMIGRAALGNPWLIKECNSYLIDNKIIARPEKEEVIAIAKKHLEYLLENSDEKTAVLEMRSHILWYLKNIPNSKEYKRKFLEITKKEDFFALLNEISMV